MMREITDGVGLAEQRTFAIDSCEAPGFVASEHVVTRVRVEEGMRHDLVHIWNRGGKCGVLTIDKGDGEEIARRLLAE